MNTWNDDDVERWLRDNPLPADFAWNGEKAWPRYQLKEGYGQWLRTAGSYHAALRGLFRLICEIIQDLPDGEEMPTPEQLAAKLQAHAAKQAQINLLIDVPGASSGPA